MSFMKRANATLNDPVAAAVTDATGIHSRDPKVADDHRLMRMPEKQYIAIVFYSLKEH